MSTPSLNEQRLDVVKLLRVMLINGHTVKLDDLDREIADLEAKIEAERRNGILLNAY